MFLLCWGWVLLRMVSAVSVLLYYEGILVMANCVAGERHRDNMFMICSGALITAAAAVGSLLAHE